MSRRSISVAELAKEADLEVESVLVALWRAGIDHVDTGTSKLNDSQRRLALRTLDLAGAHQRKVSYWLDWLGVERGELARHLAELGIELDPRSNTLPKGAIRKLKSLPPAATPTPDPLSDHPDVEVVGAPEFPTGSTNTTFAFLTAAEVRAIHDALEEDFAASDDPIFPLGVRDENLLEGAVERPATRYGGQPKYPTIALAAAALLHGLVHNHPFHNGNKRTALVALLVFLDRNGRIVQSEERQLYQWMLQVAAHDLLPSDRQYQSLADHEVLAIARWIESHCRRVSKEERSIQWRVLKRVLREHGCEITRSRGEREHISRVVQERVGRGRWRRSRTKTLTSNYINTSDGREVPKSHLKRIRQELELDEEHGIDSELFYSAQRPADYFIVEYSKTLRRLAKV